MSTARISIPPKAPYEALPVPPPATLPAPANIKRDLKLQEDYFSRAGLPPTGMPSLSPPPLTSAPLRIGVDVGGTRARIALLRGEDMAVLGTNEWYHPRSRKHEKAAVTPEILTDALVKGIRDICEDAGVSVSDVGHVGIGISGPVTPDGTIISAPNLEAFDQVQLGPMVKAALGSAAPVSVANDIDVAALGEKVLGSAQGVPTAALFYVGTGVGSGLVVDGHLLRSAGEIGHAPAIFGFRREQTEPAAGAVVPTVEAFAGGNSMAARINAELDARHDIEAGQPSSLRSVRDGGGRVTAMDIDEAARNGDPYARDFLREAADILANAMLYLTVTARLDRMVLGGGVMERCPLLRAMAIESYGSRAHPLARKVQFTTPEHGEWAGALGAAQLGPS